MFQYCSSKFCFACATLVVCTIIFRIYKLDQLKIGSLIEVAREAVTFNETVLAAIPNITQTTLIASEASLVILIPFIQNHSANVVSSLSHWSNVGDPCPFVRKNIKSIDLVFWFNLNYYEVGHNFTSNFESEVKRALGENVHCFGQVKFLSANLKAEEDVYPIGPSYQWYSAFLSHTDGLTDMYDYMFWQEHDVHPIREGFIDKLFEEVTFHGDFYVKGSIHRGTIINGHASVFYEYIEHINGNALYNFRDEIFIELLREILEHSQVSKAEAIFAMDVSVWMYAITHYNAIWERYQQFAHKFVHSDFIQAFSQVVPVDKLNSILTNNPNTFLIHGDGQSTGQKVYHVRNVDKIGKAHLLAPLNTLLPRLSISDPSSTLVSLKSAKTVTSLLVIIPFFEEESSSVLNAMSRWTEVGEPCPLIIKNDVRSVHLEFLIDTTVGEFPDDVRAHLSAVLGNNSRCFGQVGYSVDRKVRPTKEGTLRSSYQFYGAMERWGGAYDYMFWHEPDVYPIREGFIDKLYQEVSFSDGDFYMSGSLDRSNLIDPSKEEVYGDSCRRDRSALYSLGDAEFRHWLQQKQPSNYTVDYVIQRKLKDYANNWKFLQNNAHKFVYSDFIQHHGVVLNTSEVDVVLKASPKTFWLS